MPKTSFSIRDHFDSFIASQISSSRYDTESEVIRQSRESLGTDYRSYYKISM